MRSTELDIRALPILFAFHAFVLWFGLWMQEPPTAVGASAPLAEFSADRALAHVRVIAGEAHPAGSVANKKVRTYLVEALRDMGAEVELQVRLQTYEYVARAGRARFAFVENVVARFPGHQPGPALLLMAHYDSVPNGPGAGDNASGVAVELEAVRALVASDLPMRNPLIVLFSDAEEIGLIGAQAFFGHHRWAEQIALVLNFDSRGSRGPVFMYETSDRNGALVDALAHVAPMPLASSLILSIFREVPNFSDLSIATTAGKAGMNFAFIDGFYTYHRSTDVVARLSTESLQHLGSYALSLVRYFGAVELPLPRAPNKHYFNAFGHVLVTYPPWLDWVFLLLSALLLVFANLRELRERTFTPLQLLRGIGFVLCVVAVPALSVLLLDRLIDMAVAIPEVLPRQRIWFASWALLATGMATWLFGRTGSRLRWVSCLMLTLPLVGLAYFTGAGWSLFVVVAVTGVLLAFVLKEPLPKYTVIAGAFWLTWLLALAAVLRFAGGAHVVLWPLVVAAVFHTWLWRRPARRLVTPLLWVASGLPAVMLLGMTALNLDLFIGYMVPIVSIVPLLLMMLFFVPLIGGKPAQYTGYGLALLGATGLAVLVVTQPWTARTPQTVSLFALHFSDSDRSFWATRDHRLTDWHRVFLGDDPQLGSSASYQPDTPEPIWLGPTREMSGIAPKLEVSDVDGKARRLRVRVTPNLEGETITIWIKPGTDLRGWWVGDQRLQLERDDSTGWRALSGFAVPLNGVEITLDLGPGENWPDLLLVGIHNELADGTAWPSQELERIGGFYSYSTSSVAVRHVVIDDLVKEVESAL